MAGILRVSGVVELEFIHGTRKEISQLWAFSSFAISPIARNMEIVSDIFISRSTGDHVFKVNQMTGMILEYSKFFLFHSKGIVKQHSVSILFCVCVHGGVDKFYVSMNQHKVFYFRWRSGILKKIKMTGQPFEPSFY